MFWRKISQPLIDGPRASPPVTLPTVNMTQHYNRPPLDPVHVYI
jgi:hypothetical protein